jgi:Ca2+/Na+ antiporter
MGRKDNSLDEVLLDSRTMDDVRKMCRILAPFFAMYDVNGDNQIDFGEFCMICKDLHENLSRDTQAKMFEAADVDRSGSISFEEFVACLMSFALDPPAPNTEQPPPKPRNYMSVDSDQASQDSDAEEEDVPADLADLDPDEQQRQIKLRSVYKMGCGTILILLFSDAMVDLMAAFGRVLGIKLFYVSFVLAPIASNASELVAAYNYARKRTQKSITTSLSTLVGAGIMNNTFCLGVFFFLIVVKDLAWEFTAETLSIVLVEFALAIYTMCRKTMRLLDAIIILFLYVGCLLCVKILEGLGID